MAIFHITTANSVFIPLFGGVAFSSDTPGADALIVDPNAFLLSEVANGAAFARTGVGPVTVTVLIASTIVVYVAMDLAAGDTAVSTIKIGASGEVEGSAIGILLESSANINNAGVIDADYNTGVAI